MDIKISKAIAHQLGEAKLRKVGQELKNSYHYDFHTVNLADLTRAQNDTLREWLDDLAKLDVRGAKVLIRDIDVWLKALKDAGNVRARTIRHFSSILTEYLRKVPGHRLYRRVDDEGIAHVCYYVNDVQCHPPQTSRDNYRPAYVTVSLVYHHLGGMTGVSISFETGEVQGKTASEALAYAGYFVETKELRSTYLQEIEKFNKICLDVGKQFLAIGTATDDLDGNSGMGFWSRYSRSIYPMVRDGAPSKVVIDVFYEEDKDNSSSRRAHLDKYFWSRKAPKILENSDDDLDSETEEPLDKNDETIGPETEIEVPIHPYCATFDLRRHLRLKIHINYLTEYVYDQELSESLILPDITKNLVLTLVNQSRNDFADIVAGKSSGVCVLLTGKPGVGKTLTAEVFSESTQRPLYSIQAAQLGIKADEVEKNLVRFLARGSRWNAVVLIDEADVYIRNRDANMEHNAIVAAFLRVLEYQTSVLFMTTNLPETVDDAIASRCIARIDYDVPSKGEQTKIWWVLNKVNETGLSAKTVNAIVEKYPDLTGRDIKQVLKLASFVSDSQGGVIDMDTIDFVSQFRPTRVQRNTPTEF